MTTISESQCNAARVAGVLYLLMAVTAPFALIYVPSKLIVPGDATVTADRFRASESRSDRHRVGIVPPGRWDLSGSGSVPLGG
jgi:hypothetical protein